MTVGDWFQIHHGNQTYKYPQVHYLHGIAICHLIYFKPSWFVIILIQWLLFCVIGNVKETTVIQYRHLFFPEGMGGGVVSNWGLNVGPLSHILGKCSTNKLKSTTHFKDFQLPVSWTPRCGIVDTEAKTDKYIWFVYYFKCMSACIYVCMYCMCVQCPWRPEEGIWSCKTRAKEVESPCGCWEPTQVLWKEQQDNREYISPALQTTIL